MPSGIYDRSPSRARVRVEAACKMCHKMFPAKPWLLNIGKDKYCGRLCSNKVTLFKEGKEHIIGGEKHPLWKGDKVSYTGLHIWVRQHRGVPSLCEICGTTQAKRFEWANVSKEYRRELSDWIRLCKSCHIKYDNQPAKAWITRRKKNGQCLQNA